MIAKLKSWCFVYLGTWCIVLTKTLAGKSMRQIVDEERDRLEIAKIENIRETARLDSILSEAIERLERTGRATKTPGFVSYPNAQPPADAPFAEPSPRNRGAK